MRYVAVTFTDEKYIKTRQRYVDELKSKNIFSEIYSFGPEDINDGFLEKHRDFIKDNPKGYGYFIWKPYVIYKILQTLEDGDVLVYGDAGNDIPGTQEDCLAEFNKIFRIRRGVRIMASKQGRTIRWIKSDLYFTMGWKTIIYSLRRMVEAGRLVIQKNENTMEFVKEWLQFATEDYHNIDNTKSKFPNLPFFIEHRNDQSIFTILFHKYSGTITDFGEVWRARRLKY